MAIQKTIVTEQGAGNELSHHVIRKIEINKKGTTLTMLIDSYKTASNFNNNNVPSKSREISVGFNELPQAVINTGVAFLNSIEDNLILLTQLFNSGTRTNDDGTPLA
jgi:hypothetical protein